jgi:hypothetical protein
MIASGRRDAPAARREGIACPVAGGAAVRTGLGAHDWAQEFTAVEPRGSWLPRHRGGPARSRVSPALIPTFRLSRLRGSRPTFSRTRSRTGRDNRRHGPPSWQRPRRRRDDRRQHTRPQVAAGGEGPVGKIRWRFRIALRDDTRSSHGTHEPATYEAAHWPGRGQRGNYPDHRSD